MKKPYWLIAVAVVIVGLLLLYQWQGASLQSQVLKPSFLEPGIEESDDCKKLSENLANDCYFEFAVKEKDKDLCEKITKASKEKECLREVELMSS